MYRKFIISFIIFISTLFLCFSDAFAMQILVKEPNGTNITLEVESSDTIEAVKTKIKGKTGYLEIIQELVYNDKILQNGRTLADYDVQKQDTINLIFKEVSSLININALNAVVEFEGKKVTEINTSIYSSVTFTVIPDNGYMLSIINTTIGTIIKNSYDTYTLKDIASENVIMTIQTEPVGIKKIEKIDSKDNIDTYVITFTDDNKYTFTIKNGINGLDGKDGITPKLRINKDTNEWEVSYDNEQTWESLGVKASGEKGKDGINGLDGKDGINGTNGKIKYGVKEYLIIIILAITALLGNILHFIKKK